MLSVIGDLGHRKEDRSQLPIDIKKGDSCLNYSLRGQRSKLHAQKNSIAWAILLVGTMMFGLAYISSSTSAESYTGHVEAAI